MRIFQSIDEYLEAIGIESFQTNESFYIFRIEDYFGKRSFELKPYKHSFFELSFGSGHDVDITIGASKFKAIENVLSFTTPYQISSWKINTFKENSLGYMVLFNPSIINVGYNKVDIYQRFDFLNLYSTPMLSLSEEQRNTVLKLIESLHIEFTQNLPGRKSIILGSYLSILLEKINTFFNTNLSKKVFANRAEEITYLFENLLKEDVNYRNKLEYYADKLCISKTYLSESVKKSTQKSAKGLIQEFIIFKAKVLLNQSNNTIQNTATELGFNETSNFVTYFKKHVGITPNNYRKKIDFYN